MFRNHTLASAKEDLFCIHEKYDKVIDTSIFESPGYTVRFTDGSIAIFLQKEYINNIGIIVHEAFHATEFILDFVGIKHSDETSEVYAYLLQYIVNEIIE